MMKIGGRFESEEKGFICGPRSIRGLPNRDSFSLDALHAEIGEESGNMIDAQ